MARRNDDQTPTAADGALPAGPKDLERAAVNGQAAQPEGAKRSNWSSYFHGPLTEFDIAFCRHRDDLRHTLEPMRAYEDPYEDQR
jgi:hypothetical protein